MRPRHVITPLALALAVRAIVRYVRRRRAQRAAAERPDPLDYFFANDPRDPVQGLDEVPELEGQPLAVDAVSQADVAAAEDLAILEEDVDEAADRDTAVIAEAEADEIVLIARDEAGEPVHERDAGDLYGAHTPPSVDREHPDDDRAFDEGQNWLEALETSAVENGPEPELELDDIVDDEDVLRPPHHSDTRDTPVADHGAGGRSGL